MPAALTDLATLPIPAELLELDAVDVGILQDRLQMLEVQRAALVVLEWFAEHPHWVAPFELRVMRLDPPDVSLVLDANYHFRGGTLAPGGEASEAVQFDRLLTALEEAIAPLTPGMVEQLMARLNEVKFVRTAVPSALADFLGTQGIDGPAYLAAVAQGPVKRPQDTPLGLPPFLRDNSGQDDLPGYRVGVEALLAQRMTLRVRQWMKEHQWAKPLRLEQEDYDSTQCVVVHVCPGWSTWTEAEHAAAGELVDILNHVDPDFNPRAARYLQSLTEELNQKGWTRGALDVATVHALEDCLDRPGQRWLADVEAADRRREHAHLEEHIAPSSLTRPPRL